MDGASSAEDDYETLRAIAEGQGIDPEGMSREELVDTLRRSGLIEGPTVAEAGDSGGPAGGGEYGQEGVGRRESPGGPAAESGESETLE